MATPTKRHVNWTSVSFTPSGGSPTTITGVQSVRYANGAQTIKHSGDGDRYSTLTVVPMLDPTITVSHRDLAAQYSLNSQQGSIGAFTATHGDARNGTTASSGGYTLAVANAILCEMDGGGSHAQFGEGSIQFHTQSSDGTTNPLAFTAL